MNISSSIFEFELEKFKEVRVFLYQGDSSLLPSLVLASQSVEFSFVRKTRIQMLTTSCRSLTLPIHSLFKSLGLYVNLGIKVQILSMLQKFEKTPHIF